jgi:hypothetical protein
MDDDCEPDPDALERLLGAAAAGRADTTLLAPVVLSPERRLLPLNRGIVRARWGFAPLVALPEAEQAAGERPIGFCTFVGPLVRTTAARAAGLPLREMFIRNDDVEYCLRLGARGPMWLVSAGRIVHKDPVPFVEAAGLRGRLREFLSPAPLDREWKNLYALRNLIFLSRRHRVLSGPQALSYALVQTLRRLVLSDRRLRACRLTAHYAADGWAGRFSNVVPADWPAVVSARRPLAELRARSLRYDGDVAGPPDRIGTAAPLRR